VRLLLASANEHKIEEFRSLFAGSGHELVAPGQLGLGLVVDENGSTYYENAMLKARAYARASGVPSLADDSGIEVDALDGGPGIYSARFGDAGLTDEGRVMHLLQAVSQVPAAERSARYRCVLVVAAPGGATWSAEGVCEGAIAEAPRGNNGFGYDPIFLVPDHAQTMAELSSAEKNRMSHRARAFAALCETMRSVRFAVGEAGGGVGT
jgi:XTP/dITP diphosphohydrolase